MGQAVVIFVYFFPTIKYQNILPQHVSIFETASNVKKKNCICINRPGCHCFSLLFIINKHLQPILKKPNIRAGKIIREKGNYRKSESKYKNTILMSNIGNYIHC